jgi:hypothetical protein
VQLPAGARILPSAYSPGRVMKEFAPRSRCPGVLFAPRRRRRCTPSHSAGTSRSTL